MGPPMIWYFIKFFQDERYADQFMAGELYLNTLSYFKKLESEDDGRMDSTEAIAMWWQPDDISIKFTAPGLGETEITKKDLAAPVSMAYDYHNYLHVLCLYAVHTTGFECIDGKIDYAASEAEELQRQLHIDERCFKFGEHAVITPAVPFLDQLRGALKSQSHRAVGKLVEYYDERTFHGEIPPKEIPFRKQKQFSYQREFRLCIYPTVLHSNPLTIQIGSISKITAKVGASRLNSLFDIRSEQAPRRIDPAWQSA